MKQMTINPPAYSLSRRRFVTLAATSAACLALPFTGCIKEKDEGAAEHASGSDRVLTEDERGDDIRNSSSVQETKAPYSIELTGSKVIQGEHSDHLTLIVYYNWTNESSRDMSTPINDFKVVQNGVVCSRDIYDPAGDMKIDHGNAIVSGYSKEDWASFELEDNSSPVTISAADFSFGTILEPTTIEIA